MYSNTSSPEWMRDVLQLETLACLVTDFPFAKLFYDPIRDPSLQLSAGMESISQYCFLVFSLHVNTILVRMKVHALQ